MAKEKGKRLGILKRTLLPYKEGDELEFDELWSFVHKKQNKAWLWVAICRRTSQIVSYYIGNRDSGLNVQNVLLAANIF